MKLHFAVATIAAVALATGSYFLGFSSAKRQMGEFSGNLVTGISAGIRGESLPLLLSAADALSYPEQQEAQMALRKYARAQAIAIKECATRQSCRALTAQPLPEDAVINMALNYK